MVRARSFEEKLNQLTMGDPSIHELLIVRGKLFFKGDDIFVESIASTENRKTDFLQKEQNLMKNETLTSLF